LPPLPGNRIAAFDGPHPSFRSAGDAIGPEDRPSCSHFLAIVGGQATGQRPCLLIHVLKLVLFSICETAQGTDAWSRRISRSRGHRTDGWKRGVDQVFGVERFGCSVTLGRRAASFQSRSWGSAFRHSGRQQERPVCWNRLPLFDFFDSLWSYRLRRCWSAPCFACCGTTAKVIEFDKPNPSADAGPRHPWHSAQYYSNRFSPPWPRPASSRVP